MDEGLSIKEAPVEEGPMTGALGAVSLRGTCGHPLVPFVSLNKV